MADKAAKPEGSADKVSPGKKPRSPDQAGAAGQAKTRDGADQRGKDTSGDEVQPKFREALERKRAREADVVSAPRGQDGGKIHGAHGPAMNRRAFRRKSG
jgi:hypothetical protein